MLLLSLKAVHGCNIKTKTASQIILVSHKYVEYIDIVVFVVVGILRTA